MEKPVFYTLLDLHIRQLIEQEKIGVIPTDTIYGISCSALAKASVEKIYTIKQRDFDKPFIILCSGTDQLSKLDIHVAPSVMTYLNGLWPNPVTVLLDCKSETLQYLHRGTYKLAVRIPAYQNLRELLEKTGPLVSTSCNISNTEPVDTAEKAYEVFGNKIDFYVDAGVLSNKSSTIIDFDENNNPRIIRQGAFVLK